MMKKRVGGGMAKTNEKISKKESQEIKNLINIINLKIFKLKCELSR